MLWSAKVEGSSRFQGSENTAWADVRVTAKERRLGRTWPILPTNVTRLCASLSKVGEKKSYRPASRGVAYRPGVLSKAIVHSRIQLSVLPVSTTPCLWMLEALFGGIQLQDTTLHAELSRGRCPLRTGWQHLRLWAFQCNSGLGFPFQALWLVVISPMS